jgi:hypothetical protein
MTEYEGGTDPEREELGYKLNLIYVGEIPSCPLCKLQDISFLGNETPDEYNPGKSWFKCLQDGQVFSTRPKVKPRYAYSSRR